MVESLVVTKIKSGFGIFIISSKSMKIGLSVLIKFSIHFKRLDLISDRPTNSQISPYSSVKRFPQKMVPCRPLATTTTFSFEVLPNVNAEIGKAGLASCIPIGIDEFSSGDNQWFDLKAVIYMANF